MYRYAAKIRIGGSVMNEIRKDNMSAAEVIILRQLHGNDAVLEIKETKDNAEDKDEREDLRIKYVGANTSVERTRIDFNRMFGPDHVPLPKRLPEFANTQKSGKGVTPAELVG